MADVISSPQDSHRCFQIVLGITGGIAAYKSATLARLLVKSGHSVRVMMTAAACEFITPLTFQALTGQAVHTSLLDETAELGMGHIELAKWADVVIIAPASANTLAKLAGGFADNLLTTVCMATSAPIIVAPAMNQQMWANTLLQSNLNKLIQAGYHIISPNKGEQACGDVGQGRLPEPDFLYEYLMDFLYRTYTPQPLAGKTVVITAGATIEPIDPVRFLSNHSSGKMGYALAKACRQAGAEVVLVAASHISLPTPFGVQHVAIDTADSLLSACLDVCQHADIFIAAAAVADFKMTTIAPHKLKKTSQTDTLILTLTKNPDVLATIKQTYPAIFAVGFAAETQDTERYALAKLTAKHLDMLACNDVSNTDIGFGSDNNAMSVFFADRYHLPPCILPIAPKSLIADQLVAHIASFF